MAQANLLEPFNDLHTSIVSFIPILIEKSENINGESCDVILGGDISGQRGA